MLGSSGLRTGSENEADGRGWMLSRRFACCGVLELTTTEGCVKGFVNETGAVALRDLFAPMMGVVGTEVEEGVDDGGPSRGVETVRLGGGT